MVDVVAKFTLPRSSRKACFAILRNGYSWQSKLCDYIVIMIDATLPFRLFQAKQALQLHPVRGLSGRAYSCFYH